MADEEKPAVDEASSQAEEPPKSDADDIVEAAEPDTSAKSDAQEAIEHNYQRPTNTLKPSTL